MDPCEPERWRVSGWYQFRRKLSLRAAIVDLLAARQSLITTMKTDTPNPQTLANAISALKKLLIG